MPRFKCNNTDCIREELVVAKASWIFDEETKEMVLREKVLCPDCRTVMEYVVEKSNGKINVSFARFDSMSPMEKKLAIHKRSQKHFKKHAADEVFEMKRRNMQANKDMVMGKL